MRRRTFIAGILLLVAASYLRAAPLTVQGTVTRPDGSGFPGAQVELVPMASNFAWSLGILAGRTSLESVATTDTDVAGRFSLNAPKLGLWRLRVKAAGFVTMQNFPLPLPHLTELPPVILWRDAATEIVVRDPSHQPVTDVWVYASSSEPSLWRERAPHGWRVGRRLGRPDAHGRIVLPRAVGEQLDIHVFAPGSVAATVAQGVANASLVVEPRPLNEREIEIHRAGEALPGILVAAGDLAWPVGQTGQDGRLSLGVDPSRHTQLLLFGEDGGRHTTMLEPSVDGAKVSRVLFPQPPSKSGRVLVASTRQPPAMAWVWPGHDPGTFSLIDADGAYQILAPPGESFWLQGEAPGHLPRSRSVKADKRAQRIPNLLLETAARIMGRVVDTTGAPVAGARLRATALSPAPEVLAFRMDRSAGRAWSKADGSFVVHGLAAGESYELRAAKRGFLPSKVTSIGREDAGDGQQARIVLQASRPAFGRVVGPDAAPVTGAAVYLRKAPSSRRPSPWPSRQQAALDPFGSWSDESGGFAVDAVPSPIVDIQVRARGYSRLLVRGVRIPSGEGPIDLGTLGLVPGAVLEGLVTDPRGKAITGARVWVVEDSGGSKKLRTAPILAMRPSTSTRAAGRFRVEDLEPGRRFHLVVDHDDFLTESVRGVRIPGRQPLTVILRPAARVAGQVVDENQQPVPEAEVSLLGRELAPGVLSPITLQAREPLSVITDEAGRFVLDKLEPGGARVRASAEGFQPSAYQELELEHGQAVSDLRLILEPGAILEGTVTKADGGPVVGARIEVGGVGAESQAEGSFRIAGIPPGPQRVEVRHQSFNSLVRELEIVPGVNAVDLILAGDWSVSGLVLEEDGEPLEGVRLRLRLHVLHEMREYKAVTGTDGTFRVDGVANGPYAIRARKEGYVPFEESKAFEVDRAPVEGLELVLRRGAAVSGRILGVDFDDLARVEVHAESDRWPRVDGAVDYEGAYELLDLGPGDWRLIARLRGGARQAEARIKIEPEVGELSQDIEFATGLTLTGRVTYDDEPLSATSVFLSNFGLAVRRSVFSDHEGRFRVEDLQPGRYRLALSNLEELLLYNLDFELYEDRDLAINIETARLSGVVRDAASSEPLSGALVAFQMLVGGDPAAAAQRPGSLVTVGTNDEGFFSIERLTAGAYQARVQRDGYTPVERVIEVHEGVDRDALDFLLSPAEGLGLTVRFASGQVPHRVTVSVFDVAGGMIHSETRSLSQEGHAHLASLPSGTWELVLSVPGGVATRVAATVPGEPLAVVVPEASRITVRVSTLIQSSREATLTLIGVDGRSFQGLGHHGGLQEQWPLSGGRVTVDGVPPGFWSLSVIDADGQTWVGSVAASAGLESEVSLE